MAREHDFDFQGSYFGLEVDGLQLGFFTGCNGISLKYEVISFKEGDGKQVVTRKRAGAPGYNEVVLKRGLTTDHTLQKWFDDVVDAATPTPYKTASIVVYDRTQKEVARFNFTQCWPSKVAINDLTASGNEVLVEEVTMQHEFMDWV